MAPVDLNFPTPLNAYQDQALDLGAKILHRMSVEPFNLVATAIFFVAICHTFMAPALLKLSDALQQRHINKQIAAGRAGKFHEDVSFFAKLVFFFGEIEVIFGIWALALLAAISYWHDWQTAVFYLSEKVNFTEAMFVVVIMAIASTRPILNLAENTLRRIANLTGGRSASWWFTILTIAPVLGSFITEPAAMTIAALLLGKQFYRLRPSRSFEYATLGLLFTNISVGGTLTHFAAPPVLMVAAPWQWDTPFMLSNFGWKALVAILLANTLYFLWFKKEFKALDVYGETHKAPETEITSSDQSNLVPSWVKITHILFMAWTVFNAHYPVLFIGGFLFFIGFMQMTPQHQNKLELKSPMLVGFFLAGLVTHGGLQGWWISPLLGAMDEFPLFTAATALTAFNDNAAITYLSTLVEGFSDPLKYAVVAGAVAGGGLTVIANAPNPAGQAILSRFFTNKTVLPLYLALGALLPTLIMMVCFWLL